MPWIRRLRDVTLDDVASVGGKNASLGEMLRELVPLGVRVPDGFAVTADAYRALMRESRVDAFVKDQLAALVADGRRRPHAALRAHPRGDHPGAAAARRRGRDRSRRTPRCRASTARRPPTSPSAPRPRPRICPTRASPGSRRATSTCAALPFVLDAVRNAFASLFTPRAIRYRADMGFDHESVALSVGVQKMVRSDKASAGVIFTLDPETGHRGVILVTSSWGLGESVVQGRVAPDQFVVHKATLEGGLRPHRVEEARHEGGAPRLRRAGAQAGAKRARARCGPRALLARRTTTCSRSRAGRRRSRTTTRSDGTPTCRWTSSGPRTA